MEPDWSRLSRQYDRAICYHTPPTIILTSAQQVTVTATSAADQTKRASLQITVNPLPQVPYQTLPNGSVGAPYSQTIALTGGTSPLQWSVYDGPFSPDGRWAGGAGRIELGRENGDH